MCPGTFAWRTKREMEIRFPLPFLLCVGSNPSTPSVLSLSFPSATVTQSLSSVNNTFAPRNGSTTTSFTETAAEVVNWPSDKPAKEGTFIQPSGGTFCAQFFWLSECNFMRTPGSIVCCFSRLEGFSSPPLPSWFWHFAPSSSNICQGTHKVVCGSFHKYPQGALCQDDWHS